MQPDLRVASRWSFWHCQLAADVSQRTPLLTSPRAMSGMSLDLHCSHEVPIVSRGRAWAAGLRAERGAAEQQQQQKAILLEPRCGTTDTGSFHHSATRLQSLFRLPREVCVSTAFILKMPKNRTRRYRLVDGRCEVGQAYVLLTIYSCSSGCGVGYCEGSKTSWVHHL